MAHPSPLGILLPPTPMLMCHQLTPQAINKPVEIIECSYGRVPLEQLLGIKAFDLDKILQKEPDFLVRAPACSAASATVLVPLQLPVFLPA